jgi:hypothetical protein
MKCRILKLVCLLLLGAIVNVAVAWGCSLYSGTRDIAQPQTFRITVEDLDRMGQLHYVARQQSLGVLRLSVVDGEWVVAGFEGVIHHTLRLIQTEAGLPMRSIVGWQVPSLTSSDLGSSNTISGIVCPWRITDADYEAPVLLPTRPLPQGFAINTIFYAGVLWLLFMIPGGVRRAVRRKRGLCSRCGYDLRASPNGVCPECGPKE